MIAHCLSGIRVCSIGINLPGPVLSYKLRQYGASVLKIEPPAGDPLKSASPSFYEFLTQGQTIETWDLKNFEKRQKFEDRLASTDVFIASHRPDSLERLGLSPLLTSKKFPELCYINIVGYSRPHENCPGHDLNYQACAGLLSPPDLPKVCLADLAGAAEAASAVLAMLFNRQKTGRGSFAEVALAKSVEIYALTQKFGLTTPAGVLGGSSPFYNLYRCREGWLAVALIENQFQERFRSLLSLSLDVDKQTLSQLFQNRTAAEWDQWANKNGLPICSLKI